MTNDSPQNLLHPKPLEAQVASSRTASVFDRAAMSEHTTNAARTRTRGQSATRNRVPILGGGPCPRCGSTMQRYKHPPGWTPPTFMPVWHAAWDKCDACDYIAHYDEFRRTQQIPPLKPVATASAAETAASVRARTVLTSTPNRPPAWRTSPQYVGSPPQLSQDARHKGAWPYTNAAPRDPAVYGWGIDRTGRSNQKQKGAQKN
jgi:hypothetical protein